MRCMVAFVLVTWLVAQGLSLVHAVVHTPHHGSDRSAVESLRQPSVQQGAWDDALVGMATQHDEDSPWCRWVDQLCQAALSWTFPGIDVPAGSHPVPVVPKVGHWTGVPHGHYSARAPPWLT